MKDASQRACFASLLKEKNILSKGKEIKYDSLHIQAYLKTENKIDMDTKRRIMRVRLRDVPLRGNFPNSYTDKKCPVPSCNEEETQRHIYYSNCINTSSVALNKSVEYDEVFKENVASQVFIANMIYENIEKRKELIPSSATTGGPGEPRKGGAKNATTSLVIRRARNKLSTDNKTRRK